MKTRKLPTQTTNAFLLLTTALISVPALARSDAFTHKSDGFLRQRVAAKAPASGWSSVIVQFQGRLTPARSARIAALGGELSRRLPLIDAAALRLPSRNLRSLAALPFVRRLSADLSVEKADEFTVGGSGAAAAWTTPYSLSGQGVTVAIVDSGIHDGPDLGGDGGSRVVAGVSFVPGDPSPDDGCGHGTHLAGIVAGNGAGSTGPGDFRTFYGIARQASLVDVRVLDGQGQGDVSTVIAGIQWVVANKDTYHIRVLNLSMGHVVGESYTTDPLCQAVEAAWKAGLVVVCSAGNAGRVQNSPLPLLSNEGYGTAYGSITSPGNDPYVITVGAMKHGPAANGGTARANDRIATYSSRGPSRLDFVMKPDLVAPGNLVVSLNAPGSYLSSLYGATNQVPWPQFATQGTDADSSRYFLLSGTSMAAPVVAGAAALLLQKDPTLTPDTIKARLMFSADKWAFPSGAADPCTFGAGYLNIPAALSSTVVATRPAQSPGLSRGLLGSVYVLLGPVLGSDGIWGTGVADQHVLWGNQSVWDQHVLWGNSVWYDQSTFRVLGVGLDLSPILIQGDPNQ